MTGMVDGAGGNPAVRNRISGRIAKTEVGKMIRSIAINDTLRAVAAAFFMLIAAAWVAAPAHAGTAGESAEAFVRDLADSGLAMLENADYTAAQREAEFRKLVREGIALEAIGRFVVARHWRKMTKQQQAEYQAMFAEWLLTSYAGRLGGFEGQRIEVAGSLELDNRHKDVVVHTRIVSAEGQPEMLVDLRVRQFDGKHRIIDIIVEGVSMAAAQRAEFEAVIRKAGVDGLVESLRARLATLVASSD